jgi:cysteinyl-tRNA synthetase
MFWLYDSRLRLAVQVHPAAGGVLRLATSGPAPDRPAHVGDLRACLAADLIRRNAERHQLTVLSWQHGTDGGRPAATGYQDAFRADCAALNIVLPDTAPPPRRPGAAIRVRAGRADCWVQAGPVLFDGRETSGPAGNAVLLGDLADRGLNPLALRLAFLQQPYRQRLDLTWPLLKAADLALRRWRERVAEWADSPSRPMCAGYAADISDAFDDDLDTPAAVRSLRALQRDTQIPPGSKFETFAHTDQVLALDLASQVGQPRPR